LALNLLAGGELMANVMSGSGKFNEMYDLFMSAMHQRKQIINNLYIHQGSFPYVAINFDQQKNFLSQIISKMFDNKIFHPNFSS
jgi:hypothetical protein